MQIKAATPGEYFDRLSDDRKIAMNRLRQILLGNLPEGFKEVMGYGMPSYVVPHSVYPAGYHCDPKLPLPFISIASQKNHIALYHMGIYSDSNLLDWFKKEYAKVSKARLDMGKSCVRFKKTDQIPFKLIGELVRRMTPLSWIEIYESQIKNK
jgi:hypothetical protein